jgi:hypothetical protein
MRIARRHKSICSSRSRPTPHRARADLSVALRSAAVVLALQCAAPAEGDRESAPERLPKAANRCIFKRSISSYRPLDAQRLKVFADREYVVELMLRCSSLTTSEAISFLSNDEQICDYRTDDVQTDRETCQIGAIRLAEEEEAAPR